MRLPAISKEAARYTNAGGREHCSLCRHFSPRRGGRCARVLGDISPMGWCRLFSREMRGLVADASSFNGGGGPSLGLDFMSPGVLDPAITFTRASTATYFNSAGVMQTAAVNAPRWDYDPSTLALRGLLIEEARTNGIRNSTMVGAVAGSPGTAPTNWVMVTVANVVITIIGTGTENGVPYIDISLVGTPTANSAIQINTDGTTAIAATNGQTWTSSFYCSLLSGSWTNAPVATSIAQRAAGGSAINDLVSGPFVPTTGRMQRFSFTTTTNNASTAFVLPKSVYILTTASQPINVTLRLGAPQLELGAFATSYIPTTSTAVTRSLDNCSMSTASWYVAATSTLAIEAMWQTPLTGSPGTFQTGATIDDGTNSVNLVRIYRSTLDNTVAPQIVASSASIYNPTIGSQVVGAVTKAAIAYRSGLQASALNGALGTGTAAAAVPSGMTTLRFGVIAGNIQMLNGHIRAVRYWNRVLTDAEMQQITANP